jgi:hypothetical protein
LGLAVVKHGDDMGNVWGGKNGSAYSETLKDHLAVHTQLNRTFPEKFSKRVLLTL